MSYLKIAVVGQVPSSPLIKQSERVRPVITWSELCRLRKSMKDLSRKSNHVEFLRFICLLKNLWMRKKIYQNQSCVWHSCWVSPNTRWHQINVSDLVSDWENWAEAEQVLSVERSTLLCLCCILFDTMGPHTEVLVGYYQL